jgi:hypothetical protein
MGRQTRFFAVEEDHRALLTYCQHGGLSATSYLIPVGETPRLVPPTEYRLPDEQRFFCLVPAGVSPDELRYRTVYDGVRQRIDEPESPVIELTQSQRSRDIILPGRIYFATERHRSGFDAARRAYDRLARYLGKWETTEAFGYRVGPATSGAVHAGRVKLCETERDSPLTIGGKRA